MQPKKNYFHILYCIFLFLFSNFSNTTMILWISFLNPYNSLKSSNFLKTFVFHFVFICYFIFFVLDLWTASTLVFTCALLASKGL